MVKKILCLWVVLWGCLGCADDVESVYSNYRAFFRYSYVSTTSSLYSALNSPGMFCSITFPPSGKYVFTLHNGVQDSYTPTAMDGYVRPEYIAGFIVGTPQIPDLNSQFFQVAYDLVCPSCYELTYIQRSLRLTEDGHAECTGCHRSYDLNNGGIIVQGEPGHKLIRYHIAYAPAQNVMVVQN